RLETHYRDVQDMEFTIEKGTLYMLQTRAAKRTAAAAMKIAVDMTGEGVITREEALQRIEPSQVTQRLLPRFDTDDVEAARTAGRMVARGVNASPGAAVGKAIFDADRAAAAGKEGERIILVRLETSPDDVHGMYASKGILTSRGGTGSHAAVVARGAGLPAVVGCEAIRVDYAQRQFTINGGQTTVREGDEISIDGTTGEVFIGALKTMEADFAHDDNLQTLLAWADEARDLGVWANADYPRDAERSITYGAEGIGLCRTEHMFMEQERLPVVQEMILAETLTERQAALDQLLPFQRADFEGIFRAMRDPQTGAGYPVVIRLIDPPLHEFLPSYEELLVEVTRLTDTGADPAELAKKRRLLDRVAQLREANPMLGLRGCRLGLLYPEINVMQTRAILEAAVAVAREGVKLQPKIMIPLVGHVNELREVRRQLEAVASEIAAEAGGQVEYKFGTMIELPRAALTAGQIAEVADFFSFGTNDLTQTTYGMSRDDAEAKFLLKYVEGLPEPGLNEPVKILKVNPFQTLDRDGVGRLVRIAVEEGKRTTPELEVGICGEHGGDPESIAFCDEVGLNYVSCSPFRVPVARLAAAQAAIARKATKAQAERDR
ncbi:MAG TPA: putative PEP-binding protein, partial [Ktedonobacterales bacterium]